ncbi:uncharacterized protein LOC120256366 [Dioscorea cayenensis subsp. rotundata]|uniref:Uncharacterized protein LOC120256366 n=1 Tax=Dioscorea cayennensis subsp. rotundata TaxID=55577 RepID=A0AB40AZU4_DIOCR|nr:uncharacterized protein LOC120256366 [Dioscorea cayenensis subsp. rotundata]
MMKEKIPQTTLKTVPNIESRVKLFRNKTTVIADILGISGFVWNHERCTIECDKSAYDEYVKAHKEAAGLYGKSFPFFNDLAQVFAKDRAQGTAGGDIGDDAEHYQHENINLNDDRAFFEMATNDFFMSIEEPIPTQSPMVSDASTSKIRRKRKVPTTDQSFDKLNDNLNNFAEMVGPGFQAIADSANREEAHEAARDEAQKVARTELEEKIRLLGEIIFEIDGLTDDEAMFILQELPR